MDILYLNKSVRKNMDKLNKVQHALKNIVTYIDTLPTRQKTRTVGQLESGLNSIINYIEK